MYFGLKGKYIKELFLLKHGLWWGLPPHLVSPALLLFLARASPCSEGHSDQNDYGVNTADPVPQHQLPGSRWQGRLLDPWSHHMLFELSTDLGGMNTQLCLRCC